MSEVYMALNRSVQEELKMSGAMLQCQHLRARLDPDYARPPRAMVRALYYKQSGGGVNIIMPKRPTVDWNAAVIQPRLDGSVLVFFTPNPAPRVSSRSPGFQ